MPKNKPVRIVIDTNLWISFLISDRERKLDNLLLVKNIHILFSPELID
jgi:predicted nucleic acid-binding protein